ncbi:MAG: hypothetical protein QXG73_03800, partial [Candidatus Micrarchaeaceae archaeon]
MRRLSLLLMPILVLLLVGISEAAGPTLPSGIVDYVQLNLSASWNVGHGAYVQQMVNITESTYSNYLVYNKNFANFEYFYSNGTIIPSWIESNSSGKIITWVKIKNTTTSFYLGFASKTTNLLSSSGTTGIGEAPQLSSTYAQYDDGASVFNNYWNFAGTTLPSGFTTAIGSTSSITQNNGITITSNQNVPGAYLEYNTEILATSVIADSYSAITSVATQAGYQAGVSWFTNIVSSGNPSYAAGIGSISSSGTSIGITGYNGGNPSSSQLATTSSTYKVWSLWAVSDVYYAQVNYTNQVSDTISSNMADEYLTLAGNSNGASVSFKTYWLRTRAYPPSGTMPSVSFGAVQAVSTAPTLTITPNPATYGSSITITATCPSSSDSCAIDYPSLGTAIATGTGSATYTYPAYALAAGTYAKYYAVDKTSGLNSTAQTLTINKNSTTLTWLKQGKNSVYGLTQNTTAKINTHNNQLSANLYLNGNLIGSTNTIITNLQSALGTYSYTFNTTGNVNYTAASIKYNYTISAYKFLIAKVNSTAYETSTQGYAYEINVSSLVGNVILEEDGIAIASLSPTGTLPSAQWFNFTYAIPLLAVNNTAVSFNAVIDVSNTLTTVNSTTQHLLQNYFTSGGPKYNPILTGSGETFFINITQVKPLNAASVLNATLTVGNQTVPLQTVLPYKYYFQ